MTKKYYEGSYIPPNSIFFKKEIKFLILFTIIITNMM